MCGFAERLLTAKSLHDANCVATNSDRSLRAVANHRVTISVPMSNETDVVYRHVSLSQLDCDTPTSLATRLVLIFGRSLTTSRIASSTSSSEQSPFPKSTMSCYEHVPARLPSTYLEILLHTLAPLLSHYYRRNRKCQYFFKSHQISNFNCKYVFTAQTKQVKKRMVMF